VAYRTARTPGVLLRSAAYRRSGAWWLRVVPTTWQQRLRLRLPGDGRRIEIGPGFAPKPGYVHVDINPRVPQLDLFSTRALPAGWAEEVLAVHCVEHIPGPALRATLRSWMDLLEPGGVLYLHTPNAAALGRALAGSTLEEPAYWAALSAVYGYGHAPGDCRRPEDLTGAPDHTLLFTPASLVKVLEDVGFERVADVSGRLPCDHRDGWEPFVPDLCLEVEAYRPA